MNDQPWWNARIDDLKQKMDWSDARVARRLQISPAMLAHVRAGRRPLTLPARVRLLDALGYVNTRDLLLEILPVDLRDALKEWDNHRLPRGGPAEADNEGLPLPPSRPSPPDC